MHDSVILTKQPHLLHETATLKACATAHLDHLLDIVGNMLQQPGGHVRGAVHNEAHRDGSPTAEPGHEGTGV